MAETASYGVGVVALLVAAYAGWLTWRDRRMDNPLFYLVSLVELLVLVHLVGGIVGLTTTDRSIETATYVSYLVTIVLVPPAAVLWGVSDKSRWGTGVVVVGMVTVAAMELRVLDLWTGAGGA